MAIIHNTTMSPGKLELLAAWLPAQPWFPGGGREPELTVTVEPVVGGPLAVISSVVTDDDPSGTHLLVDTASPDGLPAGELAIRIRRILSPDASVAGDPCLSGTWRQPDGSQVRGVL